MTELAAANPTERAQALIQLTGRLTELLEQETELFEAHMPHKAVEFQAEKTLQRAKRRLRDAPGGPDEIEARSG